MGMIANQRNRLDPSLMDRNELEQLSAVIQKADHAALVSKDGEKIGIPEPIYRHLVRVVRMMKDGKAVVMLPENETFTTQAPPIFSACRGSTSSIWSKKGRFHFTMLARIEECISRISSTISRSEMANEETPWID